MGKIKSLNVTSAVTGADAAGTGAGAAAGAADVAPSRQGTLQLSCCTARRMAILPAPSTNEVYSDEDWEDSSSSSSSGGSDDEPTVATTVDVSVETMACSTTATTQHFASSSSIMPTLPVAQLVVSMGDGDAYSSSCRTNMSSSNCTTADTRSSTLNDQRLVAYDVEIAQPVDPVAACSGASSKKKQATGFTKPATSSSRRIGQELAAWTGLFVVLVTIAVCALLFWTSPGRHDSSATSSPIQSSTAADTTASLDQVDKPNLTNIGTTTNTSSSPMSDSASLFLLACQDGQRLDVVMPYNIQHAICQYVFDIQIQGNSNNATSHNGTSVSAESARDSTITAGNISAAMVVAVKGEDDFQLACTRTGTDATGASTSHNQTIFVDRIMKRALCQKFANEQDPGTSNDPNGNDAHVNNTGSAPGTSSTTTATDGHLNAGTGDSTTAAANRHDINTTTANDTATTATTTPLIQPCAHPNQVILTALTPRLSLGICRIAFGLRDQLHDINGNSSSSNSHHSSGFQNETLPASTTAAAIVAAVNTENAHNSTHATNDSFDRDNSIVANVVIVEPVDDVNHTNQDDSFQLECTRPCRNHGNNASSCHETIVLSRNRLVQLKRRVCDKLSGGRG